MELDASLFKQSLVTTVSVDGGKLVVQYANAPTQEFPLYPKDCLNNEASSSIIDLQNTDEFNRRSNSVLVTSTERLSLRKDTT
jgi:hypothetical protein